MHIHFSFLFFCSLSVCVCVCVCVCEWKSCPVFLILCNFIAIFFSAWPSHLARLVLAISKWLCSFFYCYFFSLHVFIYCKLSGHEIKIIVVVVVKIGPAQEVSESRISISSKDMATTARRGGGGGGGAGDFTGVWGPTNGICPSAAGVCNPPMHAQDAFGSTYPSLRSGVFRAWSQVIRIPAIIFTVQVPHPYNF